MLFLSLYLKRPIFYFLFYNYFFNTSPLKHCISYYKLLETQMAHLLHFSCKIMEGKKKKKKHFLQLSCSSKPRAWADVKPDVKLASSKCLPDLSHTFSPLLAFRSTSAQFSFQQAWLLGIRWFLMGMDRNYRRIDGSCREIDLIYGNHPL